MGYRCLSLAGVGDEEGESNCVGIVGCGQSLDVVFLNAVLKQFIWWAARSSRRCFLFYLIIYFDFCLFRTTPLAYGGSQARGQIGGAAAGLHHSHSNARSEPHLWPHHRSQQHWLLNPLSRARDQTHVFRTSGRFFFSLVGLTHSMWNFSDLGLNLCLHSNLSCSKLDSFFFFSFFFSFFCIFRAAPAAYGASQARGWIRAVAAGLHHSHSNAGSKPHLRPIQQLTAKPDT